jgi:hypothetical protein
MSNSNNYRNQFAFFLSEMLICLLAGIVMMYRILKKLYMLRLSGNAPPHTRTAVVDYMIRHMLFLFFFLIVFIVLMVCTWCEYRFSVDPRVGLPYWICFMHVVTACGVGTFTFMVFGIKCKGSCVEMVGSERKQVDVDSQRSLLYGATPNSDFASCKPSMGDSRNAVAANAPLLTTP